MFNDTFRVWHAFTFFPGCLYYLRSSYSDTHGPSADVNLYASSTNCD